MIYGTGIDIVAIPTMLTALQRPRTGNRFIARVFTPVEIAYAQSARSITVQGFRFAARFAAKEAFFKALGTGLRQGLRWIDVEVVANELGKPNIHLQGRALEVVAGADIKAIHLSLSHTRELAIASIILEK